MKTIILFSIIFILCCCSSKPGSAAKDQLVNDSLEAELIMLKNQAFCDLFQMEVGRPSPLRNEFCSYWQISDLAFKYRDDSNLVMLKRRWHSKKYKSFDPDHKLTLMKCLDFYNSEDLNKYIDSVRIVEAKFPVEEAF